MPKLRVTPSERHSQPIACLDGSVVPAGVPDLDVQVLAHSGAKSIARRVAYGSVKEIDAPLALCAHWLGAIAKGDVDPCDEATAKAAGVPASRIHDPSKPAAKKKAD